MYRLSWLVCAVIVLSLLVGCGDNNESLQANAPLESTSIVEQESVQTNLARLTQIQTSLHASLLELTRSVNVLLYAQQDNAVKLENTSSRLSFCLILAIIDSVLILWLFTMKYRLHIKFVEGLKVRWQSAETEKPPGKGKAKRPNYPKTPKKPKKRTSVVTLGEEEKRGVSKANEEGDDDEE